MLVTRDQFLWRKCFIKASINICFLCHSLCRQAKMQNFLQNVHFIVNKSTKTKVYLQYFMAFFSITLFGFTADLMVQICMRQLQ